MSNLVEIKKRISSITSTIKVTKVMQMIATAKIAKIKQLIPTSEKYNNYANNILSEYIKHALDASKIEKYYTENANNKNILFILMSSDKGTCGSINTTIFKEITSLVHTYKQKDYNITILPIGKKATKWLENNNDKLKITVCQMPQLVEAENCNSSLINAVVSRIVHEYDATTFGEICLVYHKFKNIITFNSICERLLPIDKTCVKPETAKFTNIEETPELLPTIIEFFVRTKLYNAYISNMSSIVASRMNAMDNATKNGQEIIDDLRIKYNKGRQAAITAELSDIVSGFEAIS